MSDDTNPLRPPEATLDQPGAAARLPLAGKGRRFGTLVVDYIGYSIACPLLMIPPTLVYGEEWLESVHGARALLLGAASVVLYYLFFEGLWGRTPGKLVFGTRAVAADGGPMSRDALFRRTLARLVPFEAFTFFGQEGFHDKASRTRVVRIR